MFGPKVKYLSDANGSSVNTVRGCTISTTKSARQETSNPFYSYSTVDGVFWRWRRPR